MVCFAESVTILAVPELAQAIKATFEQRGMAAPIELPVGLTDELAHDCWRPAFVRKNELPPEPLVVVVE